MNDSYCKICGGAMIGDGYTVVLHCEFAEEEDYDGLEPDAEPVYCALFSDKQ